ncbi:hypothetical protein SUGI_0996380 [Cryptomeria japonica]|nr:hypothetical protein SUGI_0996380 [Cryptomeria japonica]
MAGTTDCHLLIPVAPNMGEVDARPLESVKTALSLFGESIPEFEDGKKIKISCGENCTTKERDVILEQTQSTMFVEQLKNSGDIELQRQLELEKAKVMFEAFTRKLEEARKSKERASKVPALVKKLEAANPHVIQVYNEALKADLSAAGEQFMMATAELENIREELQKTKACVLTYAKSEALALEQLDKARMEAEKSNNKLEELVKEIASTEQSLALLQLTCIKAEKEKDALLAAKEAESQKAAEMAEQSRKDLEAKLTTTTSTMKKLQQELHLAKELETILTKVAADATQSQNDLKLKIKQAESDAETSLISISAELEEAEGNLKRMTEECKTLHYSAEFLKAELDQVWKDMNDSMEREAELEVSIAMLNAELHQSRSKSAAAAAAEARAKVVALDFSVALKQLAIEAERAKREAKALKEEARQANIEAENTKAELTAVETRLLDALKESEELKEAAQVIKEEARKEKLEVDIIVADMIYVEFRLQFTIKMVEEMTEECQAIQEEARRAKLEEEQAKAEMTSLKLKLQDALKEGKEAKDEVQAMKEEACKVRLEAEQAKANKAFLEVELQDALRAAETQKEAAHTMKDEARKAKLQVEETKREMCAVEARLQYVIKEVETARIAEEEALSEIRSLQVEKDEEGMNAHKFFTGITMSPTEYESLTRKVKEADSKAAEIKMSAKEGDEELSSKLEIANREIVELKLALEQAYQRAEKAETDKKLVEQETRKWRRRAYNAGYLAQKEQSIQKNDIIPKPSVTVIRPLNAEPLKEE